MPTFSLGPRRIPTSKKKKSQTRVWKGGMFQPRSGTSVLLLFQRSLNMTPLDLWIFGSLDLWIFGSLHHSLPHLYLFTSIPPRSHHAEPFTRRKERSREGERPPDHSGDEGTGAGGVIGAYTVRQRDVRLSLSSAVSGSEAADVFLFVCCVNRAVAVTAVGGFGLGGKGGVSADGHGHGHGPGPGVGNPQGMGMRSRDI